MNREVHVRFCERRGVRFPPATHPHLQYYDDPEVIDRAVYGMVDWFAQNLGPGPALIASRNIADATPQNFASAAAQR